MPAEPPPAVAGFYRAFETGDVAALDAVFHADWVDRTLPPGREPGLDGMKGAILALRAAVPDLRFTCERTFGTDDETVVHGRFTGTHTGRFGPIPASGGLIDFIIFDLHHLVDRRVRESWHLEDNLTVLTQMGAVPRLS